MESRAGKWCRAAGAYLRLVVEDSSVHGLNHVTPRRRHPAEKSLWALLVLACVCGTALVSEQSWRRYVRSPVVVSLDRDMFAWNTTFPCVTVCPHDLIDRVKLSAYVRNAAVTNKTQLSTFILSLSRSSYSNFHSLPAPPADWLSPSLYLPLILNLSSVFSPTLTVGAGGVELQLEQTMTEVGVCYAVNSIAAGYNSPQYWLDERWDRLPDKEVFSVHPLDGEVFAQIINLSTAYDVYLHGPHERPDVSSERQSSVRGLFTKLYVSALTVYTGPEAASLSVSQRRCRFPHENTLPHSAVYSYNQCRAECRVQLAVRTCGCVPYFYRRIGNEEVCGWEGMQCLATIEQRLIKLRDDKAGRRLCECLPLCDDINYAVKFAVVQEWFLGTNLQWGVETYPKIRYRRDIIFGFTDVLVYVGSTAGLFVGCSVLSLMEIPYVLTLRLFWYLRR